MKQKTSNQNKLLEKVFKQALSEDAPDNPHGLATHIHNEMDKRSLKPPTTKTIINYQQKLAEKEVLSISRDVLDSFSKYLDYIDYNDFIKKNNSKTSKRCLYLILILVGVIVFLVYENYRKKCMKWEEDRYVKVHCEDLTENHIDIGLLTKFKKLEASCEKAFFFNSDGSPKVWYYKRGEKDLELFSSSGTHPINGKDLHRINVDMIKKHVCPDYSE